MQQARTYVMAFEIICYLLPIGLMILLAITNGVSCSRVMVDRSDDEKSPSSSMRRRAQYEQWRRLHGKSYRDASEEEERYHIFRQNVDRIEAFNNAKQQRGGYQLGLNKFADLTNHEFRAMHAGGYNPKVSLSATVAPPPNHFKYENVTEVPEALDWRAQGAVTPVKEQLQCGCCWAFSAVAAVEGLNKIKTGELVSLSEQELLDCNGDGMSCDGGVMENAFNFIVNNNGLAAESIYPYTALQSANCGSSGHAGSVRISGYESVPAEDEIALLKAVANQPVSVGINGGTDGFQFYSGGIFDEMDCGPTLNHAVTVVGYGSDEEVGASYWIVKNSWGSGWGEGGYMRITRDTNYAQNPGMCGLAMDGSYPTL
ncbi:unnamed protein product [Cuscuta epithymum]|uniref:Cysteine protease n=1 Tax=Cuscuta epithymum TaxID=186058 RepID=A0AAV0EIQ1_9ASTE|nr:unnamed protein product [Cuscuta epithymum]